MTCRYNSFVQENYNYNFKYLHNEPVRKKLTESKFQITLHNKQIDLCIKINSNFNNATTHTQIETTAIDRNYAKSYNNPQYITQSLF